MKEIWKPVPGFGGHYEVSNYGRVRVLPRVVKKFYKKTNKTITQFYNGRLLNPCKNELNYFFVHIGVDLKKYNIGVHHLVLLAFHGRPKKGEECRHLNGFPWCNRPGNLRWGTHAENNRDRIRHGTIIRGEDHHYAIIDEKQAIKIKSGGMPAIEAAKTVGVSYKIAWRILRGETWTHI